MAEKKSVAVIGAGISGLAALKQCLADGLTAVCFEARAEIGGNWAYRPDASGPVVPSMYAGAVTNSTRDTTSFTDFPLDPARYGVYFGHRHFLRYLHEYADHFDLKRHMRMRTRVLECRPLPDGSWSVRVQEEGQEPEDLVFAAVVAASGHLTTPCVPDLEGRDGFKGEFLHSHYYRTPGPFEGKRVAIIGLGSSAVDVACEISPQAQELHLITRRGGWVLPRFVLGKPTEAWDNRATQLWVPLSISQWVQTKLLHFVEGKPPKELVPEHKILEQSPTVRGEFMERVKEGLITVHRADVDRLTEAGLALSNGKTIDVDVVIAATGYHQFDLPYLPPDAVRSESTPANAVDLYKLVQPPRYPNLFLLGFLELFGPLPAAVEAQARYTTAVINGRITPPPPEQMLKEMAAFHEWQSRNLVRSARHALVRHQIEYIDGLLEPLGAAPTFGRLLRRVFTGNPWAALKVLNAVWFGLPSSAQWRLCGAGAKEQLAREMVLRIAADEAALSKGEVAFLTKA